MKHDYYEKPVVRMGRWTLLPLDSETWHAEVTGGYFKQVFGFYKGTLCLHDIPAQGQYPYFPQYYFDRLYRYLDTVNRTDFRALAKVLHRFYALKVKTKAALTRATVGDYRRLSNRELVRLYQKNRDLVHRITVYDQFGWTAEDYWPPHFEKILSGKLNLTAGSPEYNRVLFILTKPAEMSTTLEEKKAVLFAAYQVKKKLVKPEVTARRLVKRFAWMPVFTYGTPWDEKYYREQLAALMAKPAQALWDEYIVLKNYKKLQRRDIAAVLKQYPLSPRDLQTFVDFGLALDTRNEAEYVVSLGGFYLLPMYKEMARRLYISVNQLRCLYEKEVVDVLLGKRDVNGLLSVKQEVVGWGFNHRMDQRINFSPAEAKRLFRYLEKKSRNLHGHDEAKGQCASPGQVVGRIKVVTSPAQNHKVEEGDILVCEATTVDYLPAMKKAGAFVTEVGSLTCHAAVVAREFGVPCIVSLKNATKNFKDNELVSLDADAGTLTPLKK